MAHCSLNLVGLFLGPELKALSPPDYGRLTTFILSITLTLTLDPDPNPNT